MKLQQLLRSRYNSRSRSPEPLGHHDQRSDGHQRGGSSDRRAVTSSVDDHWDNGRGNVRLFRELVSWFFRQHLGNEQHGWTPSWGKKIVVAEGNEVWEAAHATMEIKKSTNKKGEKVGVCWCF